MKIIRTSKHYFEKEINSGKEIRLKEFLTEYHRVLQLMINYVWINGVSWKTQNIEKICCPSQDYFDTCSYFDYKKVGIDSNLSARALSSMTSQCMGIISSSIKKHSKRIYMMEKLTQEITQISSSDESRILENKIKNLQKTIKKTKLIKPEIKINSIPIELSSKCITIISINKKGKQSFKNFDCFLKLKSIGKKYSSIVIPIKYHSHSNKLKTKGKMLGSVLLYSNKVDFRWEIDIPKKKKSGIVIGADTGKHTLITLSNEETTDNFEDPHNHTIDAIMKKLARKKKGSKAFKKAQAHRTNFINWSINNLNLKGIKEIKLEKVNNIFYKNKNTRFMSHWTNSEIEKAITKVCEENGVHLSLQASTYCSQRCSNCGLVLKSNRKGKNYQCKSCGLEIDADLNAAKNHALDLLKLPLDLRHLKLNRNGFFWKSTGLFNLDGSELRVPNTTLRKE